MMETMIHSHILEAVLNPYCVQDAILGCVKELEY